MTPAEALAVVKHELGYDPDLRAIKAISVLRAVVEERDKKPLIPCLHDAPEYVTAEYFKERYPHPSVVGELRLRVRYCRLCGENVEDLHLMVIGGPR